MTGATIPRGCVFARPGGMKPPGVVSPQGPHSSPVRPPALRTHLTVFYLEEELLERVVLGRGACPPIRRARLSHPVCRRSGRLRHALRTGYVSICHCHTAAVKTAADPQSLLSHPTHRPPNRQCRLVGSLASGPIWGARGGVGVPE